MNDDHTLCLITLILLSLVDGWILKGVGSEEEQSKKMIAIRNGFCRKREIGLASRLVSILRRLHWWSLTCARFHNYHNWRWENPSPMMPDCTLGQPSQVTEAYLLAQHPSFPYPPRWSIRVMIEDPYWPLITDNQSLSIHFPQRTKLKARPSS